MSEFPVKVVTFIPAVPNTPAGKNNTEGTEIALGESMEFLSETIKPRYFYSLIRKEERFEVH